MRGKQTFSRREADKKSGQGLGEVARRDALQVEPGQELLDRLGPPEVGRQDRRGGTDLAGLSRTPALAHPGAAHRDRPDAGLNPALAMMAVANDTAPPRIVLQIAVRAAMKAVTSISTACAKRRCAPERNTDVKGSSENDPGWRSSTTLSSLVAYPFLMGIGDSAFWH